MACADGVRRWSAPADGAGVGSRPEGSVAGPGEVLLVGRVTFPKRLEGVEGIRRDDGAFRAERVSILTRRVDARCVVSG